MKKVEEKGHPYKLILLKERIIVFKSGGVITLDKCQFFVLT
jgi:hypothetical protein